MPNTSPNPSGRSITDSTVQINNNSDTAENKTIATAFINAVINSTVDTSPETINTYFHDDFLQHNPNAGDDTQSLLEALQNGTIDFSSFQTLHKVIAENGRVLTMIEGTQFGIHSAFYQLFRPQDSKIIEQWNIVQNVPEQPLHNNIMFNFDQ